MIANLENTASSTRRVKSTATPRAPRVTVVASVNRPRRRACQGVAKLIGGIASLLVILSVWHLTAGISVLTGSNVVLALFLAIGIDLGMIASELAELVASGNRTVAKWARAYMVKATVISMALNAYEFASHAPEGALTKGIAIAFGILLPMMIFILARLAAHLYETRH